MVVALFSVLFVLYLLDTKRTAIVLSKRDRKFLYSSKNYIVFFTIFLICISALRAETVGIDTESYIWSFLSGESLDITSSSLFSETEVGFLLLKKLFSITGLGYRGLLVFCSISTLIPIGIYIYHNSCNPFASFFIYVTLDYFFFSMTGLRQSLAVSICLLSLKYVKEKKMIPFLFMILLASSIHKTAIVFIPFYFLSRINLKRKHILIVLCCGGVLYLFRSPIRALIRTFARINYSDINTGGTGYYLLMVVAVLVFLFTVNLDENRDTTINFPVNMVVIATLLFPILQYNPTVLRLHYYYSIALIILIPNTIRRIEDKRVCLIVSVIFFLIPMYYFIFYTSKNMGILPYQFCF